MSERRQLINVAYRLLGSLADAEDVVQETYARWYALTPAARAAIESPAAWMTRVASRICLDLLGSARVRRERYVGEWLPEPVPRTDEWNVADPADRITLDESVNMAFLIVLDTMTSAERVAFILHDVFRYSFAEVGEIVGRTPAACRQLASSARRRVRDAPSPATTSGGATVRAFKEAWEARDINALVALLDPNVRGVADGGGRAQAALMPVEGAHELARGLVTVLGRTSGVTTMLERTVNGQPGLVIQEDGVTTTVMAFEIADDRITRIWAIRNPEKLGPWTLSKD
jgi:RNA polymerase sigma factor (sigma-70 family)